MPLIPRQRTGEAAPDAISVAIADDHPVVRAGIRMLLAEDPTMTVVGEADDFPATVELVRAHCPTVLILDLHMGGELALQVLPRLAAESPGTGVLVFTVQQEAGFAKRSLRAGARGYLRKDAREGELVHAVRAVAAGRNYLDTELGAALAGDAAAPARVQLTTRQRDVLTLIMRGASNRAIAQQLHVSVRTVESLRAQIRERTGLSTQAELVAWAAGHRF